MHQSSLLARFTTCLPLVVLAGLGIGCTPSAPPNAAPCADAPTEGAPYGTRCGHLVDDNGRVRILRGVNARVEGLFDVTFDDGRIALEDIPAFEAEDALAMRDWGFDSLRLPINWSGIEPSEDGGFDETYLNRLEDVLDMAHAAGLSVLVDFHQDAYSKEIGEDGAPLWAIKPPPTELLEGPLTDLQDRRLSAQVLAAFETFFGETPTGTQLRERFVLMAAHVAARFADHPAVYGFEIFNEPQTDAAGIDRLNEAAYEAMRDAAPDKLYVFEPEVTRNFLDRSRLAEQPLGPMTAYAPHVYTYAFTATDAQKATIVKDDLKASNENARLEADSWEAPLIITEWGFDPLGVRGEQYLQWQVDWQDTYFASGYFWLWKEESQGLWGCHDYEAETDRFTERQNVKGWIQRTRAMAIAGWPRTMTEDRQAGRFTLTFGRDESIRGPHLIVVSPAMGDTPQARCNDAPADLNWLDHRIAAIECRGDDIESTLVIER